MQRDKDILVFAWISNGSSLPGWKLFQKGVVGRRGKGWASVLRLQKPSPLFSLLSRELLQCLRSIGQTRNSTVSTIRFVPFFSLSLPSFLFLFSFLFFFFIFVSNTARNKSVTNEFSIVRRDYRFFSSLGSPVPFVYRAYYNGITEAIIGGIYIFDNYLGDDSSRSKR